MEDAAIPVTPGPLAERSELEELRAEVERLRALRDVATFARQTNLLQKVTAALTRAVTTQDVADVTTAHGRELFGATASMLFLLDDAGATLELASFAGVDSTRVAAYRRVPVDAPIPLSRTVRTGEPIWIGSRAELVAAFPDLAPVHLDGAPLVGFVALPLRDTRATIGGLAFSFYAPLDLDAVQRDLFLTVCSQCGLALERARSFEGERRAREQLEQQQERLALLVRTAEALASSLDSRRALVELARRIVPALADWCAIDELGPNGGFRRLAVEHRDPAKVELAWRMFERYPPRIEEEHGVARVLRSGETEYVSEIPDAMLVASARDEEHLALARSLGLSSFAVVPLRARGRVLGALSLVTEGDRRLDVDGVRTAEELGRRAALALDNARLYEAAEAARSQLHGLFMQAPAAISICRGPDLRFEFANEPYRRLVGHERLVGRALREALPDVEDQPLRAHVERAYAAGETFVASEMPLRAGPGDPPRHFNIVFQAHRDATDAVDGVATFAFEVTDQVFARREVEALAAELRRAEAVAREQAETLAATNRELDQFAYVTSHDLRAPLRGIASLAEWLEEDLAPALTDDARHKLALLRRRVRRMEAMIQGILDFSRVGRMPGKAEPVDVAKLALEVVELLAPKPPAAVTLDGPMPRLVTERVALQQVLLNLIGNGLKHAGRPDALVRIGCAGEGDAWRFRVADNGPGIAPEYRTRVWGIFQTLEARDKVENTGIGLAIVKKIVDGRGGRVWIESVDGGGSAFLFTWPKRENRTP